MNFDKTGLTPIVCVLGATGSGKNDLALELSRNFSLEIINFDSRQVYKGLEIITAQPSPEDKKLCAHHLYGFLEINKGISAGKFTEMASSAINKTASRKKLPFLVGGTGLYLRSLIYGLAEIPKIPDQIIKDIQKELSNHGIETLYQELSRVDPVYSSTITARDRQKISRALGVYRTTGEPISKWHERQNKKPRYKALLLGIKTDLEELTPFLALRIEKMIGRGAIDEVQRAYEYSGQNFSLPGFSGIGCREIISYIEKEMDLQQAKSLWLKNTRAYAKRQITWFRKEPGIIWTAPGDFSKASMQVEKFLKNVF
ncbi:tRNA (adenosine(37)-N6)-dimethylallyltransferase MiaA [Desulfonatronovibrio hydrogenovorans]|uniref:tRNA (adenosine(37)-N6)-dimethylallyltransferase MiaA n=1 Tax=Desulfonatronovibrio hydrogenovorans TaxID=53245 RepID=UPI00048FFF9A|nr:tRNA (adenosine(37)-N6)-dimethylallyltransferase MiaA [Desulfonatronovibrio hydrogenovorans]